jgi:hypothetical protein
MSSNILSTLTQVEQPASYTYTSTQPFIFPSLITTGITLSTPAVSYDDTTGIFTVNNSGTYNIDASIALACGTAITDLYTANLVINSIPTGQAATFNAQLGGNNSSYTTCWISTNVQMPVGATFYFQITFNSGTGAVAGNNGASTLGILLLGTSS